MKIIVQAYHLFVDFLTAHPSEKKRSIYRWAFLGLFLAGLIFWGFFLNWGAGPVTFHDWALITGPRLTILRNAITSGSLPLNTSIPVALGENTSTNFLAIPDLLLSPQILLLPLMSISQFSLFQIALLYSFGFWGLLALRKRMNWSLLTFTIVDVLFNFNGHITDNIAVGHLTWAGYFLFPWFARLIFEAVDRKPGWVWIAKMALVMFAILLQGSYHQFIWLLFFLGFFAIAYFRNFIPVVGAAIFSVLLGLMRLIPELSLVDNLKNDFLAGYPGIKSIFTAMIDINKPIFSQLEGMKSLGYWEISLYIGIAGVIFLVIFGLFKPWFSETFKIKNFQLYLPIFGMIALSLTEVYKPLRETFDIPPISGERVATRIISVGFVFLLFLAANGFQRWLDKKQISPLAMGGIFTISAYGLLGLYQNARRWRLLATSWYFPVLDFDETQWTLANEYTETGYLTLVLVGVAVTLSTAVFLAVMAKREKKLSEARIPSDNRSVVYK